jgi:anti-sigma regulatory factor (Ser/Thr protein kinase)
VVTLDLPPEPRSATRARQLAREHLAQWCPAEMVETAALLVTELVTNAVLHARTAIVLKIDAAPGLVVLRVADQSNTVPIPRAYARDAATGRGLALVDELATAWGVEHSANGKEVWCEIEFEDSADGMGRTANRRANQAGS